MKKSTIIFISISLITSSLTACRSKPSPEAKETLKDIQSAVQKHTPGAMATSSTGFYMKAKIDNKEWEASFMVPDESATSSYKTVHGENGATYMNFQLWRRGLETGKSIAFAEDNAANLSVADVEGFWSGKQGQVKITAMNEQWTEGVFDFNATSSSSDKIIHVTGGSFRVPTPNTR